VLRYKRIIPDFRGFILPKKKNKNHRGWRGDRREKTQKEVRSELTKASVSVIPVTEQPAAKKKSLEQVKALMENGADVNAKDEYVPLVRAAACCAFFAGQSNPASRRTALTTDSLPLIPKLIRLIDDCTISIDSRVNHY
jgi:hypothetical protein